MKTSCPLVRLLALLALLSTINSQLSTAHAQGTAFTYQGRLSDGTNTANGIYDLRFSIWNLATGGRVVAGPLTNTATLVSNGLFTVTLDFGPGVFGGDDCWLGMGVRVNNGESSFTTLSPRQQLTATPYAILASGVGAGDITANMLSSGAVTSDKIAAGAIKGYQIDDGGSAAYQAFQTAAQSVSSNVPLAFTSLALIAPTNGVTPTFTLAVSGLNLSTVVGFSGSEGLSRPYYYVVEVQSSGPPLDTDAELGLSAYLTFTRNGRTTRFGGIVTACTLSGASSTGLLYTVRIEPPLAYLGFTTDYHIYQNLNVPDVASSVYQSGASKALTSSLQGSYSPRDYLCQYAETDLIFFNRLLEYNGIFYFFNQSANPPTLTLGDETASYLSAPNSSFVYYGDTATNVLTGADYIRTFQKASHQSILKSTVDAYNFQIPHTDLTASLPNPTGVGEHYEFSAVGTTPADDQVIAGVRRGRQSVERATMAGSGTAPDLRPGYTFTLTDQTAAGLGTNNYVVTDVQHAGFVRVTNGVSTLFYGNQFQVIPASLAYRPALRTPKPQALPCTAVVTGQSGEEIWTDKYGRVKVQFHWDRYGANDQNSSAWLRQTSPMASSNWRGMMFLPRIGDEVLVSFIQGDPDQPVITGSLYNAANMPPYELPSNQTVSTIRSTGSKGQPSTINEIKFDDLAGKQVFDLQAGKDMNISVAHDLQTAVTHNLTITAANDLNITAADNLNITAAGNLTIQANNQMTINGALALTGNLYLSNTTGGAGGIYFGGSPVVQSQAGGNFFAGLNAGNATMGGGFNTAVGSEALEADTTGADNTAFGYGALQAATTGSENTASGVNALNGNLNGNQNVALGAAALISNSSGSANTASGYEALLDNTSGSNNTAHGYKALYGNTTGNNNTALGYQAGYNLTTGNNNIDLGNQGAASDNGVIRLGTPGTHVLTFIAGMTVVSNNLVMNDHTIQLRGDLNHGVGWYGVGKTFAGVSVDGPVVFGYSGGGLGTVQTGTATNLAVYWNAAGNVGIGTNSPTQKLVVAGNIYATGTITPNSDRNQKTDFAPVDAADVLAKVAALPIQQWRFKAEDGSVKHLGPMAQDFRAAFGLGEIPTAIATVDADGVALAAIQGLNQKLEETRAENAALKARLERLEQLLNTKNGGEL